MVERYVVIAPLGDNPDALYVGLREFPTKKIVLIAPRDKLAEANKLRDDLQRFRIPVDIVELKEDLMEGMFEILSRIKRMEGEDNILVNVSTGDKISTCAALSASYVNSLRAFSVMGDKPVLLPMLRFSYSKLLAKKKMEILGTLSKGNMSFDELAEKMKISPPLLSYHLNGDRDTSGLIELGLVETVDDERRKQVFLSSLGRLFAKGYLQ